MSNNLTIFRYLNKRGRVRSFRSAGRTTQRLYFANGVTSTLLVALVSFAVSALLISCSGAKVATGWHELRYTSKGAEKSTTSELDRILGDSSVSTALLGITIASADSGEILYERNGSKLFHPASNMKLLTTATAVRFLGTWYKFRTEAMMDGLLLDSTLQGNLIVTGCGDPLLTTESLDSIAGLLAAKNITSITGDLVGNVSAFDSTSWGAGWMWDDEPSTDAAFISPLTVNENSIDVEVSPGRATGDRPLVSTKPPGVFMRYANAATTSNDTLLPELQVDRIRGENVIALSGRISPSRAAQEFSFSVRRPEMYFLELLRASLEREGITLKGKMRLDTIRGTTALAAIEHPLDSVLHRVNKPSDNLAAENLLKTIGRSMKGAPGTTAHGLTAVKEYLALAGADTERVILADGSGLSWYNAVSTRTIIPLLLEQYRHRETFPSFYESLPIAGIDGTLKNRMKGGKAQANVHAKTGSLTGVSALSGYVTAADGTMLAFSILCNHFPYDIGALRDRQNAIMEVLAGSRLVGRK